MNSCGTADCQLLHLADYGTMPPGQGAHEGRKARGLWWVWGRAQMPWQPDLSMRFRWATRLIWCLSGCQHGIGRFNGLSKSTLLLLPSRLEAEVFEAGESTVKSHFLSQVINNWWVGSAGQNAAKTPTYQMSQPCPWRHTHSCCNHAVLFIFCLWKKKNGSAAALLARPHVITVAPTVQQPPSAKQTC